MLRIINDTINHILSFQTVNKMQRCQALLGRMKVRNPLMAYNPIKTRILSEPYSKKYKTFKSIHILPKFNTLYELN